MKEIQSKEDLIKFLDSRLSTKEVRTKLLRLYALTRAYANGLAAITRETVLEECTVIDRSTAFAVDLTGAPAEEYLYIIRRGEIACIDMQNDATIAAITKPDDLEEAPY